EPYKIFLPRTNGQAQADLSMVNKGDTVRVTGIALQYAPVATHRAGFELLIGDVHDIIPVERAGSVATPFIGAGMLAVILAGFLLWSRERRLRNQRKKLRKTYQLGEEILSAGSPVTILKRLSEALPAILGVTRVQLYVFNRTGKTLD